MKTKIVISAVNLVEGGPLTILRSCLKALNDYSAYNDVEVLALVHKKELCSFSNITYIEVPWAKNNWIYRIFFEFFYLKKNSRKIKPYLWFSLHDTSPNVKAAKRVLCIVIIQLHFMFLKCLTYGVIIKNSFFLYSIVIYIK